MFLGGWTSIHSYFEVQNFDRLPVAHYPSRENSAREEILAWDCPLMSLTPLLIRKENPGSSIFNDQLLNAGF
jgi:hypothetical protein